MGRWLKRFCNDLILESRWFYAIPSFFRRNSETAAPVSGNSASPIFPHDWNSLVFLSPCLHTGMEQLRITGIKKDRTYLCFQPCIPCSRCGAAKTLKNQEQQLHTPLKLVLKLLLDLPICKIMAKILYRSQQLKCQRRGWLYMEKLFKSLILKGLKGR